MSFWELFYETFLVGAVSTAWAVGDAYKVLVHLFYVLPLGALMFIAAYWASKCSGRTKERLMQGAGILLIFVLTMRSVWFFTFDPQEAPFRIVGFEISEIAAYFCVTAALLWKRDWVYRFAFPLGLISFFAAFLVPYTVLKGPSLFAVKIQFTFWYHWLNGFIAMMIPICRGWRPKKSDWKSLAVVMAVVFALGTAACRLQGRNWAWLNYLPSGIPVLSLIPWPWYIPILYLGYTLISVVFLDLCIWLIAKVEKRHGVELISRAEISFAACAEDGK